MEMRRGVLRAFDSVGYTATVELAGSIGGLLAGLAVARNIDAAEMTNGRSVAVLFFDSANPGDAVVAAVWS